MINFMHEKLAGMKLAMISNFFQNILVKFHQLEILY